MSKNGSARETQVPGRRGINMFGYQVDGIKNNQYFNSSCESQSIAIMERLKSKVALRRRLRDKLDAKLAMKKN